ncbi:MAG: non-homologous end-joining DNA ligase [Acidobacteria bacterium]|nr:non-homologous end-joining DNA ligase [Acidobacteriota bacterium]MCA1651850.1 non-homologous end-joining DNA ligase [Acidobacteriota bacterium]
MRTAKSPPSSDVTVAGLRLSHHDRLIYPELGLTKLDLARYYEAIGEWILPHVQGRPLTLVHCPKGLTGPCTYMRHSKVWGPDVLRRVRIREQKKVGEYLVADSVTAIVGLVQMGVVEIHTWNSKPDHLELPDRIIWDLDPGPAVPWSRIVRAATMLRAALEVLGLKAWIKTTGGQGLHVVVPVVPARDWSECLAFARGIAQSIEHSDPSSFTTTFPKQGRQRKILVDYLRNNRTNTSVAAFSTRAREKAPVSVPIAWDELGPRRLRFTVRTVLRRLTLLHADPWEQYWKTRQRITDDALTAVRRL